MLGFEVMPRPDFPFPGYWLGVNGKVQVHMGPHGIANSELYYLGSQAESATTNSGVVDHIAFLATDPQAVSDRLQTKGVASRKRYLPAASLFQIFVQDPDGTTIELNFHGISSNPLATTGGENYADMPRAATPADRVWRVGDGGSTLRGENVVDGSEAAGSGRMPRKCFLAGS